MEFTGERYIPSINGEIKYEHLHRYALCRNFVSGKSVLDIASGEGYGSALLAKIADFVIGVDISSESVKYSQERYYDCENLNFLVGSCDSIPLAEKSVDIVVSFETIEHHDKHEDMMLEIKRVLKKDNLLIISSPNRLTYSDETNHSNPYHVKELYYDEFTTLLKCHFNFVEIYGQRIASASFVFPLDNSTQTSMKSYTGSADNLTQQVCSLEAPIYYIAICSDNESHVKSAIDSLYVAPDDDLLRVLQSKCQSVNSQLQQTQSELEQSQSQFQQTQSELEQSQSQFQQTQSELEQSQSQFQQTQSELEQSQSQLQQTQSELEQSQSELEQSQSQLQQTQSELEQSRFQFQQTQSELEQSQLDALNLISAMQTSKFWKLRIYWFKIKGFLNLVPPSEIFTPIKPSNIIQKTEYKLENIDCIQEISTDNSLKMFAFISGCPGDSYRYRCQHQAEILTYLGYTVDVYKTMIFPYEQLLAKYKIIVAHRVPHTYEFEKFVTEARERSIKVVFDTDDLVFDVSRLSQVHAYNEMDKQEKALYKNGIKRYNKSLSLCDYVTVSTEKLQQEVKNISPNTSSVILRNCISNEMEKGAATARKNFNFNFNEESIRIAYLSGTKTHEKDFEECVLALKSVMTEFSHVRLMIVGYLDIPKALQELSSQIEYVPHMPWQDLPTLYCKVDINLAPLEQNNDFTESKSELKYLEAALLSVPTIASNTSAFCVAIDDGINGRLCNNLIEWQTALHDLVTNHTLRQEMGHKAFEDVNYRYLTRVVGSETVKGWQNLLKRSSFDNKPLSIAFILRAPIAHTGGGYKHIFNLAYYLADRGHHVNIYIEPIAHLTNFTTEKVKIFCEDNFGKSKAIIHCGHDNILESDIAIATNWPTAYVVAKLINTRFKAYYVQDYEPDFYQPEEDNFARAEATYDLPLCIITLGKYLSEILSKRNKIDYPFVNFPLHEEFLAKDPIIHRHLSGDRSCSILFFARPHIPRRNFALGVEALHKLYQHNSNIQLKLYGLDESLELPFPYENLGVLTQNETAEAMRTSDIHLSFSMTNISTVVFEAMACGCATVEVDVASVRAMVEEGNCLLCEPNSEAVFKALMTLTTNDEMRRNIANSGYESVRQLTLQNMCLQFEKILMEYSFSSEI
jgi:O-antigen biosynthesis protein